MGRQMTTEFTISTNGPGLYEFTDEVTQWVRGSGLLTLFIRHTSASLLITENHDPEVRSDMAAFFERLVPPSDHPDMAYLTHIYEGPDDMPAHIKAALLPSSLQIPVISGAMQLGTWQGVYLFEHRHRPHHRRVVALLS